MESNSNIYHIFRHWHSGCMSISILLMRRGIARKIDPQNQTITFDYDSAGRLTTKKFFATGVNPDTGTPARTITYTYGHNINNIQTDDVTAKASGVSLHFLYKL